MSPGTITTLLRRLARRATNALCPCDGDHDPLAPGNTIHLHRTPFLVHQRTYNAQAETLTVLLRPADTRRSRG